MQTDPHIMANVLEEVRRKILCAYVGAACDCKYGADDIGSLHESGNGCPEIREIIALLRSMTKEDVEGIRERFEKSRAEARRNAQMRSREL